MAEISDDELEAMMERKPTIREAKVDAQLKKEVGVDDTIFNFQIDFLTMGNYLKIEGETFRLNDRGLVLLSNI